MSYRRMARAFLVGALAVSTSSATWAAESESAGDEVCYRVKDPVAISGTVVTSNAVLGVSPPCRIDAAATEICVPASAAALGEVEARRAHARSAGGRSAAAGAVAEGEGTSTNAQALATVQPQARLCYSIECPDDVAPPPGAVSDALGKHELDGFRASRLCVPASLGESGAAAGGASGGSSAADDSAGGDQPSVIGKELGCGDANADGGITASDALAALRTAVGLVSGCGSCACDVNNSNSITASDALSILRAAVGQAVTLGCPEGPFFIAWDGGGDGTSWQDALNWDKDGVPRFCDSVTIGIPAAAPIVFRSQNLSILALASTDDLTLESGSLTLRQASSETAKLTLSGSTLTVVDTLSVNDFDWKGGSIDNAGTTTVTGTLTIDTNDKNLNAGTLIIDGTGSWPSTRIFGRNGTIFRLNAGHTLDISGDVAFFNAGGGTPVFDNQGTLLKSDGTGTTQWSAELDSTGTVDLRAGTFQPSGNMTISGPFTVTIPALLDLGGTNSFDPASTLDGTGPVQFTSGTTTISGTYAVLGQATITSGTVDFTVPVTIPDLEQQGGTLRVDETAEITNTFEWLGGSIEDAGTTTVTGALTISGNDKNLNAGTLIIDGTASWPSTRIFGRNGTIFRLNAGRTLDISGDVAFFNAGGGTPVFDNQGTFLKSDGTGTTQWSAQLTSPGTVDLRAGTFQPSGGMTISGPFTVTTPAALDLGGTNDFAAASNLSGTGPVQFTSGTTTISGTYAVLGQATITSGTVEFAVPVTIPDFKQQGGTLRVDETAQITSTLEWLGGSIEDAGTTTVTGALTISGNDKNLNAGTLIIDGTASWPSTRIFGRNGTIFRLNAGRTLDISGDVAFFNAGGGTPVFDNQGTFLKSDGTGTTQWSAQLTSPGTVDLRAGTFQPSGGMTISGPFTVTTPAALDLGGTNDFAAASNLSGTGTVQFTSGTTTISGTYAVLGQATITSGTVEFAVPVTIPDFKQQGGTLRVDETAQITSTLEWLGGSIEDAGTTTVTGALTISGNDKNLNAGTLIIDGTASWPSTRIFGRNGTIFRLNAGRTLEISGDVAFFNAGGGTPAFENQGTVDKSGGTGSSQFSASFQNDGSVELHTGVLDCSGGYTQTGAASLSTDVAGVDAASIGRLQAASVTLDGDLEVVIAGGYTPQVNDTFSVLGYTSHTGTFATITPANLPGGLSLAETYGATALSFEVQ